MAIYELNQLFIAHLVGGAFGNDRPFELGGFRKVVLELLLDCASAGEVNLLRVHQMAADLFEILSNQSYFEIVRGILVRIGSGTWILGMTEDVELSGGGVAAYDGRVVRIHPNSEPFFVFF